MRKNKGKPCPVCLGSTEPKNEKMKKLRITTKEILNIFYGIVGGYMILVILVLVSMM